MRDDDRDVGGHAWLELEVGVVHGNDDVVRDHVLHGRRGVAHLHDVAVESAVRKRIDGKIHLLPDLDHADIGLGHGGVDLHFREVVGDDEKDGRIHRRGDGLAHIDAARNDDAVDRRMDRAMVEIDLRFLEIRLFYLHRRLGLVERGRGVVEIGLR